MVDWSLREKETEEWRGQLSGMRKSHPWPQQIEDRKHCRLHTNSPSAVQHVRLGACVLKAGEETCRLLIVHCQVAIMCLMTSTGHDCGDRGAQIKKKQESHSSRGDLSSNKRKIELNLNFKMPILEKSNIN